MSRQGLAMFKVVTGMRSLAILRSSSASCSCVSTASGYATTSAKEATSGTEGSEEVPGQIGQWRVARERTQVHGLGRLAAKFSKPVIDVCKLDAIERPEGSKYDTQRLRKSGLIPAVLMPHKNTETLGTKRLSLQIKQVEALLSRHRSDFAKAQLIKLQVPSKDAYFQGWTDNMVEDSEGTSNKSHEVIHALIRQFQFHVVTADTLTLSLQRCPPDTLAKVRLPIQIIGEDASSALKKNGYLYPVRPFVDCKCDSNNIPPYIEYNFSKMTIGQSIRIKDLEFHDSIKTLEGKSRNPEETLYKMIKL